eukprot:Em0017g166a
MFGTYRCEGCSHTWCSGNAWNGYGQQCKSCKSMIMPELQPLRRGEHEKEGPPHQQALCERCQILGRNCRGELSTMMGRLGGWGVNHGVDDDEEYFNEVDADPGDERDPEEYFDDHDNDLDYEGEYYNHDGEYGGESDD